MGGRGGSSGCRGAHSALSSGNAQRPQFEGSEKQIKWANDIVDEAIRKLQDSLKNGIELDKFLEISDGREIEYETEKMLNNIVSGVLRGLPDVWSAKDVIQNRNSLNPKGDGSDSVKMIRRRIGIVDNGKGGKAPTAFKVQGEKNRYECEKLKSSKKEREKFKNELIEFLKKHK